MTELAVGDRVTCYWPDRVGTVGWVVKDGIGVEWDNGGAGFYPHDVVTLVSDLMPVFLPRYAVAQVSEFWVGDAPNLHSVIGDACRAAQAAEVREAALAAETGD